MIRNPSCELCSLSSGEVKTVCMEGREVGGPSKIMFVGQSPWKTEDAQGLPFVGDSGRLLDEACDKFGIGPHFRTNVVRCAPFLTAGKVTSEHIKACAPYLDEEIERIKPDFILAFGNEAIERLLGRRNITQIAGKEVVSEKFHATIFPMLHPSAILRDMGKKDTWMLDFHRFAMLVKGEVHDTPPVEVAFVHTPADLDPLCEQLRTAQRVTIDFEAKPVEWWDKRFVPYSVAFSWEKGKSVAVPLEHPACYWMKGRSKQVLDMIGAALKKSGAEICYHNSLYDALVWYRITGEMLHTSWDTMVAAHDIDENTFKSLKWLGKAHLGYPNWDIGAGKDLAERPLDEVLFYNGVDTAATFELWKWGEDRLAEDPALDRYFRRLRMPMVRNLERQVARGVYVDRHELADQLWRNHKRIAEAASLIPVENPGSTQQIAHWLYEVEGLPVIKRTETGAPSSDEETINRLAQRFPQAKNILHYRHPRKMEGTYLRPPAQAMRDSFDGRPHPEIRTTVARTGRLSGGHHTIPRPDPDEPVNPRYIYTAPPGWTHLAVDYSQGESRLVAWAAAGYPETLEGATGMLAAWADRTRDVYVETAADNLEIVLTGQSQGNKAVSKKERQEMGKVPVLAMQYDISAKGLREYAWSGFELEWSEGEAARYWSNFHNLWSEIKRWHLREGELIKARGYVRSKIGRIRHLPNAISGNQYAVAEAIREGINAQIQSLLSDILQRAHTLVNGKLDPERAYVVANIHDALGFEVRDDYLEEAAHIVINAFRYAPISLKDLGLKIPVGLIDCEATAGPWGKGVQIGA